MSNYHLENSNVSRGKGMSAACRINYITGESLHDNYTGNTYYRNRSDVLWKGILLPECTPRQFYDLQTLCNRINDAENRWDARLMREYIGSLPNELPLSEQEQIVRDFVAKNFTEQRYGVIAAIHPGMNNVDPSRQNPHVHILATTRTLEPEGFCKKKDPAQYKKSLLIDLRKQWAQEQNRAYERNCFAIRVSHESLYVQGKLDREPTIHLSRMDWQKEQRGERTERGNQKREIQRLNEERIHQQMLLRENQMEIIR